MGAGELHGGHAAAVAGILGHGIGQLDLAACTGFGVGEDIVDLRGQQHTAQNGVVAELLALFGLLDHVIHKEIVVVDGGGLQAAVAAHIGPGHSGDTGSRAAELLIGADELGADRILAPDHIVAVDDHERVVTGKGLCHAHGVAQAQRLLLAHKEDVGKVRDAQALLQHFFLAGGGQLFFQLGAAVKVILDDALVAAQNDQNVRDAGLDGFLHQILDGGLIHDGKHPLGHGLGGGQHTGAQTGGRDDSLRNFFHGSELLHHIISG